MPRIPVNVSMLLVCAAMLPGCGSPEETRPETPDAAVDAGGDCIDLAPTADAEVWSRPDMVDENRGTLDRLTAVAWTWNTEPATFRFFLAFDLGGISPRARIERATLSLFGCATCSLDPAKVPPPGGHSSLTGSNEAELALITTPWEESTVTWNTQPLLSATTIPVPQSTSSLQDYHLDVTDAVIAWRDAPDATFGFGVKLLREAPYRSLTFQSREYAMDPARRPRLRVCLIQ